MNSKDSNTICGVVMPISAIDGCNESHWADVLSILNESIELAGFDANIVSNADDVGVIHKRIIQNLYENPIVVCDVSGKNPNVMFELGMRLAFDKPTIIVKDDKTPYSFDTSGIEHLEYPRDLRFSKIVDFKERLSSKIKSTYDASVNDRSYTTFLKNFGEFTVAKLDKKEISGQEFIIEELRSIRQEMRKIGISNQVQKYANDPINYFGGADESGVKEFVVFFESGEDVSSKVEIAKSIPGVLSVVQDNFSLANNAIRVLANFNINSPYMGRLLTETGSKSARQANKIPSMM